MSLKVAFQMDHVSKIDIRGDTTFALMLEAQARGHAIHHYTPERLSMRNGRVEAGIEAVKVADVPGAHAELGDPVHTDLSTMDVVMLRQDPPFDMAYITSTHLLERIHPKTLVVNDPTHVRNAPEKLWVLDFLDLMPPTMVTRSLADVEAFRARYRDIIIKPLYGNGGASVFRIQPGDTNLGALVELFQTIFREPFMVQEYRPEVREGDKRIILVDGDVAGVINRIPAEGETRSNLHVGGTAAAVELSARDHEICARLGPELKRRGLIFTGIDVIGPYLTEINVTSPTGIRHIQEHGGSDIAAMIWNSIEWKTGEGRVMAGHG